MRNSNQKQELVVNTHADSMKVEKSFKTKVSYDSSERKTMMTAPIEDMKNHKDEESLRLRYEESPFCSPHKVRRPKRVC